MLGKIGLKIFKRKLGVENLLQTKPFKGLPERLIIFGKNDHYIMFSPKSKKQLGIMHAYITPWPPQRSFYPEIKEKYKCLYIDGLIVNEKRKGVGKDFIQFAKHLSENSDAERRINLHAWCLDDSKTCPQIFYHKMGFTTTNKKHLKEIKRLEATGTITPRLFGNWNVSTNMYLAL